jgi:drug/metabolite transporter (DMT)-like permease
MTPAVLCGGFVGTLISCGMSFATGVGLLIPLAEALWCSALGVVQLGLGSVLFALAAQTVPAVQLTLFSLGEPVLAPIWVLIAFNEVPTGATLVGGGILLIALVLQLFDRSP